MMYFGVKAWGFQDFFHFGTVKGWTSPKNWNVLFFKNIEAPCGWKCNVHSFLASLVILVPRGIQISVLFWVFIWNVLKKMHFQLKKKIFRKASFLRYPPLKPKTIWKIEFLWVLTSQMKPGKSEHYIFIHREPQCF